MPALVEPKYGKFPGMDYPEYDRIKAVRSTELRGFETSPLQARHNMMFPTESKWMTRGHATHTAVLEPDLFTERFAMAPGGDGRRKEVKLARAAFEAEVASTNKTPLPEEEWNLALRMRDAAYRHPIARELLTGPGVNELVLVWKDEPTGTPCKARIDRAIRHYLSPWDGHRWSAFLDVKTSKDHTPYWFSKDMKKFGYHHQAAHYIAGGAALAPVPRKWIWIVIQNEPPHDVVVYEFHETGLQQAEIERQKHLATLRRCAETDSWPGYSSSVESINLPAWAFREE